MKLRRFAQNPIITRALDPSIGNNIDGPSLIRVPDWIPHPLGRYYLYFAHHQGGFIRLAYADDLRGPWTIHAPGVLNVEDSTCTDHAASPDVHVDHSQRRIRMYFHGVAFPSGGPTDGHEQRFGEAGRWIGTQRTKLALSRDGLSFQARGEVLGASYFRVFQWAGWTYAMAMPGVLYRSRDGIAGFEPGPILFPASFRHCAVHVSGSRLHVFFTRAGDCPESILHTAIDLRPDWHAWTPARSPRSCGLNATTKAPACLGALPSGARFSSRSPSCAIPRSSSRTAGPISCMRRRENRPSAWPTSICPDSRSGFVRRRRFAAGAQTVAALPSITVLWLDKVPPLPCAMAVSQPAT